MAEVTNETLLQLEAEGKTPKEIGEIYGLTPQKIGSMLRAAKVGTEPKPEGSIDPKPQPKQEVIPTTIVTEEVEEKEIAAAGAKITIRTAEEYFTYQKSQGRTAFGGKIGEKIPIDINELRAYINAKWTPSMIMEKYQQDVDGLQQALWKLSKKELREKPLSFNLKHNVFKS